MKLLLNSTPVALWYDIIHDAEMACSINLSHELESYLVFLLLRYSNKPELLRHIIATEFLKGAKLTANTRQIALQEVGDKCLLFSGLFPQIAERRLVKISYYVNMGQTAYDAISLCHNDIYDLLSTQFVTMMDVLQTVRCSSKTIPDLLPIQAYDLWNETDSKRAFKLVKNYSNFSLPVKGRRNSR